MLLAARKLQVCMSIVYRSSNENNVRKRSALVNYEFESSCALQRHPHFEARMQTSYKFLATTSLFMYDLYVAMNHYVAFKRVWKKRKENLMSKTMSGEYLKKFRKKQFFVEAVLIIESYKSSYG